MRLELGCPVRCTDGPFGEVADVVVDAVDRRVTHLVVAPHRRHGLARLVPIELAEAEDGCRPSVGLRCTGDEARRLPSVSESAYLRLGELPLDDPDWDVGIQNVLAHPSYEYAAFGGEPLDLDPHVSVTYDRIPKGEVELSRASDVLSADGHWLGHVDGFVVEPGSGITHLVLGRGHLFGRREVTIPIQAVARVETDSVTLALTKDEVGELPAVPVRRTA